MAGKTNITVTLVNKYYAPDSSITAESASDLAQFLLDNQIEVNIVCAKSRYGSNTSSNKIFGKKYEVSSSYDGKNKIRRLIASTIESYKLIRKARSLKSDYVIVMTSPPLLNFFANLLFKKSKQKWIYWSMDLYPEAFRANGLVSSSNPIYKYVFSKSYSYPPGLLMALGREQYNYLRNRFKKEIGEAIVPCGVFVNKNVAELRTANDNPEWKTEDDKIYFGYIGNLGEAHSTSFLKEFINEMDLTKHRMILVAYGSRSKEILDFAADHPDKVIIKDFVPRDQLKHIDVHLTSLRSEWVHICVPSKLVSAVSMGGSFIFCGPEESDSWRYLNKAGWLIEEKLNMKTQLNNLLKKINVQRLQEKKQAAQLISIEMQEDIKKGYDDLLRFLRSDFN